MRFFKRKNKVFAKIENSEAPNENLSENIFDEAQDWEASKRIFLLDKLRLTTIVGGVFFFTTVLLTIAIVIMLPLKSVQLQVVKVDESTGIVEVLEQNKDAVTNYDETVNTYFVKRYIRYREGYSYPLMSNYYNNIGLLSSLTEQQNYAKWFNPNNPDSPLNLYGQKQVAIIKFKSVTYLKKDVALVRFIKEVKEGDSLYSTEHLTATVRFIYSNNSISNLDKEINPLGFQVVEYRIDEESVIKN